LYFFDKNFHRGLRWYEAQFASCRCESAIGEVAHDYLFSPEACGRIRETLPNVRLIVSLRNPVDRAFSTYLFLKRHGLTTAPFREALATHPEIITNSLYAAAIERYVHTFGRNHLHVIRFADIASSPIAVTGALYRFLDVEATHRPALLRKKILPAARARSVPVAYAAKQIAVALRAIGLPAVVGHLKRSTTIQRMLYVPYTSDDYPQLDDEERARLTATFSPDIARLEAILGESYSDLLT